MEVQPGSYTIILRHAIPKTGGGRYWVEGVATAIVPIPPLSLSADQADVRCQAEVEGLVSTLRTAKSETELAGILASAEKKNPECAAQLNETFRDLTVSRLESPVEVRRGEEKKVTVCRSGLADNAARKCWTLTLKAPVGTWNLTYGFTFVPDRNRGYFLDEMKESTSATDASGNTTATEKTFFLIEEERRPSDSDLDLVPSLLYSFTPAGQENRSWRNSFLAGLGYDLETPSVFAGWGWTHYRNVTLTVGLAVHQQTRLRGRYEQGERLEQTVAEDSLVDSVYRPNLFLGIAFRFDSAPFAAKKSKAEDDNDDTQPKDTTTPASPAKPASPTSKPTSSRSASASCSDVLPVAELQNKVVAAAQNKNLVTLVRHGADCAPSDTSCKGFAGDSDCKGMDRILSLKGSQQALNVRSLLTDLGAWATPVASPACRTQQMANAMSGLQIAARFAALDDGSILDGCRETISQVVSKALEDDSNHVMVTHSNCIAALASSIESITDEDHGMMVFFSEGESGKPELLGCAWPTSAD